MKLLLYSAVAATLVLSSCSSAYKAAQTPDDVYNSPSSSSRVATSRNADNGSTTTTTDDGGTYVTYDDGSQYDSDYGRRMDMFSGKYVSGSYSDYYSAPIGMSAYYGSPWYSYYPYSGFGLSYGMGYGWGLGFGLGIGLGWGYSPWYSPWYSPFYSPYYAYGYGYYPYYGGGYYHGGYYGGGHGYYYSNTVNRIRTNNMPTAGNGYNNNGGFIGGRTRTGVVANPGGRTTNVGVGNTRRVFAPSAGETSAGFNGRTRTFSQPNYQPVQNRTFSAPTRTFSAPSPSFSAPRSSGGGGGFSGGGRRR
ncbi:hypothetical protein DCC81_20660 [Chitinophaga parva]|uniref:Prolyl-tRNA synthetase n=1 Tax=Chitinophaga parva TaxID=2169414 RepID=A0A2T7BCM9_9BACT|nr:hypothetical protein [Chitinophaga parva]PUZ22835.1 hypothetical protein DCC81_20660 [Chitinophaga parva]